MEKETGNKSWKELIGQPKGIIFSDLDGVWFDESNNFAGPSPDNLLSLKKAQNKGYLFILTSDTGAKGLFTYTDELGIKSPLVIAEAGICIQGANGLREILVDPEIENIIKKFRSDFIKNCETIPGSEFLTGDATSLIRRGRIKYTPLNKNNYPFFAINTVRNFSFGVYSRIVKDNKLTIDESFADNTYETLSRITNEYSNLRLTRYPQFGSCLVRPYPRPDKAAAIKRLLDLTGYQGPCYMIGNEVTDSMKKLSGRVTTCAVGNANFELKQQADFITPENLTVSYGADYIVRNIINKSI